MNRFALLNFKILWGQCPQTPILGRGYGAPGNNSPIMIEYDSRKKCSHDVVIDFIHCIETITWNDLDIDQGHWRWHYLATYQFYRGVSRIYEIGVKPVVEKRGGEDDEIETRKASSGSGIGTPHEMSPPQPTRGSGGVVSFSLVSGSELRLKMCWCILSLKEPTWWQKLVFWHFLTHKNCLNLKSMHWNSGFNQSTFYLHISDIPVRHKNEWKKESRPLDSSLDPTLLSVVYSNHVSVLYRFWNICSVIFCARAR